jgi:hypothetical protein
MIPLLRGLPRLPLRGRAAVAAAVTLAATAIAAGCSGPASFVDPEADLGFYEKVGVLPFESLARDRLAGEKVASVFFTELLARGFSQVADPGQLVAATARVRGNVPVTNPWSSRDLARLGEEAGVQALFLGTVREYEMTAVGRDAYPLVAFEVRLVDAATGRLVWSSSQTRRGGPAFPLMSWREVHTLGELSTAMCRDALETLR